MRDFTYPISPCMSIRFFGVNGSERAALAGFALLASALLELDEIVYGFINILNYNDNNTIL
jgi:hypothetical protein